VAGRYGVWAIAAIVATVCVGAGPVTAAVASPVNESVTWSLEAFAVEPGPASVPETPSADVPVAEESSPTYTPAIMLTGLVFLGGAILLVVRAGSTRQVEEPQ
jgi:hypothetical protein